MSGWTSKRDYTAGRAKVDEEGVCRVCGSSWRLEAAHVIPRSRVRPGMGEDPRNIVPLCGDQCHPAYDQGRLDLLPYLTASEQAYAVEIDPGGLMGALQRVTNARWQEAA